MEFLFIPIVFGIAVVAIAAALAGARRYAQQWRDAAEQLELSFQPGGLLTRPKLSGRSGDLQISVDVSSSSSASTSSVRTRYRVRYPSLGLGLHLARQTGLDRVAAVFGAQDVNLGDATFDEAFTIKADAEELLSALLTPSTRQILVSLVTDFRSVKIDDEQIRYDKNGIDRDAATVVRTVQRLTEAARALRGTRPGPPAPQRPAEPVTEERPPEPVEAPRGTIGPDPFAEPALHLEPLLPMMKPADQPQAAAEPVAIGHPREPRSPGTDLDTVAFQLFGRRALSFEITRQFEESHRGLPVQGEGTLRSAMPTGDGRSRITVELAPVPHDLFGEVTVVAEFELSGSVPLQPGHALRFSGSLEEADPMMRRLIIGEARILPA